MTGYRIAKSCTLPGGACALALAALISTLAPDAEAATPRRAAATAARATAKAARGKGKPNAKRNTAAAPAADATAQEPAPAADRVAMEATPAPAPSPMSPDPSPAVTAPTVASSSSSSPPSADVAPSGPTAARAEGPAGAIAIVAGTFEVASRSITYSDRITSNLRTYDGAVAPIVGGSLELYPMATSRIPLLRDLGITGGYREALAVTSQTATGEAVSTSWSRADVGARLRVRLGETRPVVLGLAGGYTRESLSFAGPAEVQGDMPSVAYECLRAGGDVRVPVGPLAVYLGGAYLPVLRGGDVASRVRRASVGAVEAELGIALPFAKHFEARLGAGYTRYFYSFRPLPGDTYVAGGALDQVLRGQTALAFVY